MKKFSLLLLFMSLNLRTSAQNQPFRIQSRCRNIYVWDFLDQEKNKNRTTNDLTEAVEEALTNIDECFVLQRRNLANLINHATVEKGVNSIKEMRRELTGDLSGNGARFVLFGIIDMSARDACEVKLRIEDITTTHIVFEKSARILNSDIANIDTRNQIIYRLVCTLVGKPVTGIPQRSTDEINTGQAEKTGNKPDVKDSDAKDYTNQQNIENDIAVVIINDQNVIDNAISTNVSELYRDKGFSVTNSLFTDRFTNTRYFSKVENADLETLGKLGLSQHLKYIVLGRYSNVFENGNYTKFICRARLKISLISCSSKSLVSSFELRAANGFDDKDHAEQGALEKLLQAYRLNHLKLTLFAE